MSLINLVFILPFIALLVWIFWIYKKLAQTKSKSVILYGLMGIGSLMFGTFIARQLLILFLNEGPAALIASLTGFLACFGLYQYLKRK